jgi:hypothetical protein
MRRMQIKKKCIDKTSFRFFSLKRVGNPRVGNPAIFFKFTDQMLNYEFPQ